MNTTYINNLKQEDHKLKCISYPWTSALWRNAMEAHIHHTILAKYGAN